MTEEFFKKAKELMTDKEALEKVRYKQEHRWNGWGINDRETSEHFEFRKNYAGDSPVIKIPPKYTQRYVDLTLKILEEIEQEIREL